jgi:MFS family permease
VPVRARGDLAEYALAVRSFSRNARLFIVHVIGMDTVHGTSLVLVNLYFLAVGLPIEFIGLRLLLGGIAGAAFSVPAGLISDRIGRKWSFIIGDGVGAALYLLTIFSVDQSILLATGVLSAMSGTLHGVSEPAFMAENSEQRERVHLFSVSDGLRTLSAMVGSLLGGFVPLLAPRSRTRSRSIAPRSSSVSRSGRSPSSLPSCFAGMTGRSRAEHQAFGISSPASVIQTACSALSELERWPLSASASLVRSSTSSSTRGCMRIRTTSE